MRNGIGNALLVLTIVQHRPNRVLREEKLARFSRRLDLTDHHGSPHTFY